MRVIIAIHGIYEKDGKSWIYDFCKFAKADERFKDDVIIPYSYGFVLALQCIQPVFKYLSVKRFMSYLRDIRKKYPDADISIVAHSYGTELSFQAIKRSGEDGKSWILVKNLILVASIVSSHREIPYTDTLRAGKIRKVLNYCSFSDIVCRYNPFGHSGCFGFFRSAYDSTCYEKPIEDLEIYNYQQNTIGHSDYFIGDKFYKEWLNHLGE